MSPMTPSDDERDAMQDRTPETNLPPTKPFIDMKTTLKNMIQDYDTAPGDALADVPALTDSPS